MIADVSGGRATLLAVMIFTIAIVIGGSKVRSVRDENAKLAAETRACQDRVEAFLVLLRAASAADSSSSAAR